MKTKQSIIYALLIIAVLVTSCSKTPVVQPAPAPAPVVNALSKAEYGGGDYDSLYYNNDLQVIKIVSHTNAVVPFDQVFTFEYDASKKLTRIVDYSGERYDYVYVDGVLSAVKHYIGNTKTDFKIYDYTNGKLTNVEEYYQVGLNGQAYDFSSELEMEYYPDGNLKKQTMYGFDQQTRNRYKMLSTTYSDYDTKQNTAGFLNRFTYYSQVEIQKNNPGKMTGRDEVNGIDYDYNFTYTYNDFFNPLTQKRTGNGEQSTTKLHYY